MEQIRVLSSQLANLIAAGEVVDRPASVAKELCENALDAGARHITVETRAGGTVFLRVTDDGKGMSELDARQCVLRHATSKISTEDDLAAIGTLGFRGEALAAISAVSNFSILTKRPEEAFGRKLCFSAGELLSCEEAGCPDGTTVIVEDLFFNQPARRKFLKRDATEQAALLQYMQRIAIAFPAVSFKCISEGAIKFQTPGDGDTLSAIRAVYGREVSASLFPVEYTLDNLRVHGFLSRPEEARPTRSLQCFYVNARYVKSKTMLFAMDDAFKSFLKSDRHPVAFLFLETAFSDVDVNVHPAKLEVRFSDEKNVYRAVYSAIRTALGTLTNPFGAPQSIEPEIIPPLPKAEQMRFRPLEPRAPQPARPLTVSAPFSAPRETSFPTAAYSTDTAKMPKLQAALFELTKAPAPLTPENDKSAAPSESALPSEPCEPSVEENNPFCEEGGKYLGAVFQAYLLYELSDKLYVIDKHAAHERILYEALRKQGPVSAQQMLAVPVIVSVDAMEAAALTDAADEMQSVGFLLDPFGENTFALRGVPLEFSGLGQTALSDAVSTFANELIRGGKARDTRRAMWDRTLFTVACKAAMKAGRLDRESDCLWIIEKLREMKNVFVCPHGRPIVTVFDQHSFEKLFFRA